MAYILPLASMESDIIANLHLTSACQQYIAGSILGLENLAFSPLHIIY